MPIIHAYGLTIRRNVFLRSQTFVLDITVVKNGFLQASSLVFDTIDIYGIVHPPRPFYVNKKILGDEQVTNTTSVSKKFFKDTFLMASVVRFFELP